MGSLMAMKGWTIAGSEIGTGKKSIFKNRAKNRREIQAPILAFRIFDYLITM